MVGRRLRVLLVAAAVVTLGGASLLAYRPAVIPAPVTEFTRTIAANIDVRQTVLLAGGAVGLYAFVSSWLRRAPRQSEGFVDHEPERPARDVEIVGSDLDAVFARRRTASSVAAIREEGPIHEQLRTVLLESLERDVGERDRAQDIVDAGEWTDDRYAAVFLSTADTIDYPLYHRLYAWLYPGPAFAKRVNRTLRAIEARYSEWYSSYEPPTHENTRRERLQRILSTASSSDGDER